MTHPDTIHAKRPPISMGYSIEAINAAIAAARVQALEEAAKLVENEDDGLPLETLANAIRELIGEQT